MIQKIRNNDFSYLNKIFLKSENRKIQKLLKCKKEKREFIIQLMIDTDKKDFKRNFSFNKNYQNIERLICKNGKTLKIKKSSPEFNLIKQFKKKIKI